MNYVKGLTGIIGLLLAMLFSSGSSAAYPTEEECGRPKCRGNSHRITGASFTGGFGAQFNIDGEVVGKYGKVKKVWRSSIGPSAAWCVGSFNHCGGTLVRAKAQVFNYESEGVARQRIKPAFGQTSVISTIPSVPSAAEEAATARAGVPGVGAPARSPITQHTAPQWPARNPEAGPYSQWQPRRQSPVYGSGHSNIIADRMFAPVVYGKAWDGQACCQRRLFASVSSLNVLVSLPFFQRKRANGAIVCQFMDGNERKMSYTPLLVNIKQKVVGASYTCDYAMQQSQVMCADRFPRIDGNTVSHEQIAKHMAKRSMYKETNTKAGLMVGVGPLAQAHIGATHRSISNGVTERNKFNLGGELQLFSKNKSCDVGVNLIKHTSLTVGVPEESCKSLRMSCPRYQVASCGYNSNGCDDGWKDRVLQQTPDGV